MKFISCSLTREKLVKAAAGAALLAFTAAQAQHTNIRVDIRADQQEDAVANFPVASIGPLLPLCRFI